MEYALRARGGWRSDLLIADCEDIENRSSARKSHKKENVVYMCTRISRTLRSSSTATWRTARQLKPWRYQQEDEDALFEEEDKSLEHVW